MNDFLAQRGLSEDEMRWFHLMEAPRAQNHVPTLEDAMAQTNYRPPVFVPAGWACWFSIGDQLL